VALIAPIGARRLILVIDLRSKTVTRSNDFSLLEGYWVRQVQMEACHETNYRNYGRAAYILPKQWAKTLETANYGPEEGNRRGQLTAIMSIRALPYAKRRGYYEPEGGCYRLIDQGRAPRDS